MVQQSKVKELRPNSNEPPSELGPSGRQLWSDICADHYTDRGQQYLLCAACQALDRAETLRVRIDREGEMLATKHGPKENPLLKLELQNRSFMAKTLRALLPAEKRPVGRPPKPLGWVPGGGPKKWPND